VQYIFGGCDLSDYQDLRPGNIVLVSRGTYSPGPFNRSSSSSCPYREKIDRAIEAGAAAVLLYAPEDLLPTLGGTNNAPVPVFGIGSPAADYILSLLLSGQTVVLYLLSKVEFSTFTTLNILAETKEGRSDRTIVVGSHLDSVPAGPGINDNGSGSAAILEAAIQFGKLPSPVNRVRFAWWAAEGIIRFSSPRFPFPSPNTYPMDSRMGTSWIEILCRESQ